ncbi:enoyl-CoA hydratase/isomerase family protein [Turneriella parva]|uniref:Enoyl-CoA hydratase/isomerase n=1 Tax=Turneriella parva (strain ATCC BAA-1111 / DSM 21527 / NCTC 11395 / H) TaxID=869212 RepID=I4B4W1_TURPD|nr:enoyl-CoA hydratase/isomerase family protein [Turneriella parva]AFM12318.1 Enoyl-CoA hydratase/isomerase [Turneriella parva DSM 21527]
MPFAHWQFRIADRVATVTLNRPGTGNNINLDCLAELKFISEAIQADASIHAVVLRSEGKHFSVGMDVAVIQQMAGQPFEAYAEHLRAGQRCIDAFEAIQQPIVAEIRGFCIGAGVILAACADFRLSSARAVYSLPEVQRSIGVIMGLGRVTRIMGTANTKRMAMLGEKFSAAEMQQMGFLTQVAPDEKLSAEVDILLKKIMALPPKAVSLNKRIADFASAENLRQSQLFELEQQFHLNQTQDFKEAMQSFFEKRPPRYRGV